MKLKKKWIYDIEIFPNFFCVSFLEANSIDSDSLINFMVYGKHQNCTELVDFIQSEVEYLIGYNNSSYDNLIINYIVNNLHILNTLKSDDITHILFNLSNTI